MLRRVISRPPIRVVTLKPPTEPKPVTVESSKTPTEVGPYQMIEVTSGRLRDWSKDSAMRDRIHLGRDVFASVEEWQQKVTISFRAWSEREGETWGPTKRGVNISLEEWRVLVNNFDIISLKMADPQPLDDDTPINLTAGVEKSVKMVKVGSHYDERQLQPCKSKVDIRTWRQGRDKLYPTKQGMRLHDTEFEKIMQNLDEINNKIDSLEQELQED